MSFRLFHCEIGAIENLNWLLNIADIAGVVKLSAAGFYRSSALLFIPTECELSCNSSSSTFMWENPISRCEDCRLWVIGLPVEPIVTEDVNLFQPFACKCASHTLS